MISVKDIRLDPTRRVIVISDIHANLSLLDKLLRKVNFTEEDYLFINGDLCEKGPNSLEVVKYVRDLSEKNDRVCVTKGNCDVVHRYVFEGVEGILNYMKKQPYSILNEMLRRNGRTLDEFSNLQELAIYYKTYFHSELDWLDSLPHAYDTGEQIIIHAGIDHLENWRDTEEMFALSTPSFYENEHRAEQPVVVGHWPVVNYRSQVVSSNNPIIDLEKRIIALDGGNQIKKDGQLNALLIENGHYSYSYVDELVHQEIIQKDFQDTTGRLGTVTYPNYDMEIIRREANFTLCKNRNLKIEQWVKNEYIVEEGNVIRTKGDLSTTFLSVLKSEPVWIIDHTCAGYALVKKSNGDVGWIPKDCLPG